MRFIKKSLKFVILKKESYSMAKKNFQYFLIKTFRTFPGPCVWKDVNNEKKVKNIENICTFCQKNAKNRDVKMLKPFHYHYRLCSNLL